MKNIILSPIAVPDLVDMIVNEIEARRSQLNSPSQEQDLQLTIKELASFLGCSKVTVHQYRKQGLPCYQIGRKVLFSKKRCWISWLDEANL